MNAQKVSIVIVNYNGKDLLQTLLKSISKSTYKNFEIIMVDNGSSDGSQEFIKKNHKKIRLVQNKKNLIYSGINSGLKFCRGKYILFLNNDMELDKNCIKNLVKTMESGEDAAMIAPKLVNFYNKKLISGGTWVSRAFYNGHIRGNGKNNLKEMPYLGVGLIKKDFVDMSGYLFDPDYLIYAEDLDLGLRIRLNGKKIIFDPNSTIYHMHNATMKNTKTYKATFLFERNSLITFFKVLSVKNILLLMPYVFLMRLVAILKDVITLKFMNSLARIYAILWVLFHFDLINKKRKQTQKLRKADDNFLFKVFSEKQLYKKKFVI